MTTISSTLPVTIILLQKLKNLNISTGTIFAKIGNLKNNGLA